MIRPRRRVKMNIPMCISCILFCLTLFSIHLTCGLYARYTTSDTGSDSARVIGFGTIRLTESGDFGSDGTMMIIPGVDIKKNAVVEFTGSEAATYVYVEVVVSNENVSYHWTTSDNTIFSLVSGSQVLMQWQMEPGWTFQQSDEAGTYTYYRELAPNTPLSADIIANGMVTVSDQITKSQISGMTGIAIKFRASAVQKD